MDTDEMKVTSIEALIEESHLLHQELGEALEGHRHDGSARGKLTTVFLRLAQQHAFAFRCLIVG